MKKKSWKLYHIFQDIVSTIECILGENSFLRHDQYHIDPRMISNFQYPNGYRMTAL